MARVFVQGSHPADLEGTTPLAAVRHDAVYFFLYPDILKLQAESGQLVDPQKDAVFQGQTLELFRRFIQIARERTLAQPSQWSQHVGQTGAGQAVLQGTSRAEVLELLDALAAAADRASSEELSVWFVGD